jgi:hypothetical protein
MSEARGVRRYATGARSFADRISGKQRLGIGAAFALLVTAPFGGLQPAPAPDRVVAKQELTVGPFRVVVDHVSTVSDLEPSLTPEKKGNRLIAVVGTARKPGTRPEYAVLLTRALSLAHAGPALLAQGCTVPPLRQ